MRLRQKGMGKTYMKRGHIKGGRGVEGLIDEVKEDKEMNE